MDGPFYTQHGHHDADERVVPALQRQVGLTTSVCPPIEGWPFDMLPAFTQLMDYRTAIATRQSVNHPLIVAFKMMRNEYCSLATALAAYGASVIAGDTWTTVSGNPPTSNPADRLDALTGPYSSFDPHGPKDVYPVNYLGAPVTFALPTPRVGARGIERFDNPRETFADLLREIGQELAISAEPGRLPAAEFARRMKLRRDRFARGRAIERRGRTGGGAKPERCGCV